MKPFSPETLAERWECSAETVRQMIHRGELPAFRVGRMMRITAAAVEEHECKSSASEDCAADTVYTGHRTENVAGISFRHAPERRRKPKGATAT